MSDSGAQDSTTSIKIKLNAILRGSHIARPIEDPQLMIKMVEQYGSSGSRSPSSTTQQRVFILTDKEGYARALTGEVAERARKLMKALDAANDTSAQWD